MARVLLKEKQSRYRDVRNAALAAKKMQRLENPDGDHLDLKNLRHRLVTGARLQAEDLRRLARARLERLERAYAEDATTQTETDRLAGRRGR